MSDESTKAYLTPSEVAEMLRVAPVTVRAWAQRGVLEAELTPGGHRRFLMHEVERFAQARGLRLGGPAATPAQMRVLIVDDNSFLVSYLGELLGLHGALTASACDGFEAGLKLLRFRPDVVLLDLMMPGLDGFAVCRQIKSDPATQNLRVVAVTGFHTPEHAARILEAGAECCLAKPFDEPQLLELLGLTQLAASA